MDPWWIGSVWQIARVSVIFFPRSPQTVRASRMHALCFHTYIDTHNRLLAVFTRFSTSFIFFHETTDWGGKNFSKANSFHLPVFFRVRDVQDLRTWPSTQRAPMARTIFQYYHHDVQGDERSDGQRPRSFQITFGNSLSPKSPPNFVKSFVSFSTGRILLYIYFIFHLQLLNWMAGWREMDQSGGLNLRVENGVGLNGPPRASSSITVRAIFWWRWMTNHPLDIIGEKCNP